MVFVVEGVASAQLPLRLLGFFAQQDLLPKRVHLTSSPAGIAMSISESTLDEHRAEIILAKMQALPEVESATLNGFTVAALNRTGVDPQKHEGENPQ